MILAVVLVIIGQHPCCLYDVRWKGPSEPIKVNTEEELPHLELDGAESHRLLYFNYAEAKPIDYVDWEHGYAKRMTTTTTTTTTTLSPLPPPSTMSSEERERERVRTQWRERRWNIGASIRSTRDWLSFGTNWQMSRFSDEYARYIYANEAKIARMNETMRTNRTLIVSSKGDQTYGAHAASERVHGILGKGCQNSGKSASHVRISSNPVMATGNCDPSVVHVSLPFGSRASTNW